MQNQFDIISNNLGYLYIDMGDYTQAETYLLEAKIILEKTLLPDYTAVLNNLGKLYEKSGDYAKSEKYYLELNAILEKSF